MNPTALYAFLLCGVVHGQTSNQRPGESFVPAGIVHHYVPHEKNVISPKYTFNPCAADDTDGAEVPFEQLTSVNELSIRFIYEIETVKILPEVLENVVLKNLERTIVEELIATGIFDEFCNSDRRKLFEKALRRRIAVVGITTSPEDEVIGLECQAELDDENNDCYVVDGEFKILTERSENRINTAAITDQIRIMMNVNQTLDGFDDSGFVEKVRYRERTSQQVQREGPPASTNNAAVEALPTIGLSTGAIAIMALAAVLVLGGALVYRKRRGGESSSQSDVASEPTDASAQQVE